MAGLYQLGRHWNGTRLNTAMISAYLDPDAKTGLDIGSNDGATSAVMAKLGLAVQAFEGRERNKDVGEILASKMGLNISFEKRLMLADELETIDDVDVSLLLSVHHQIVANMGWDHANAFLRRLGQKTRKQLFFQPACIDRKYKQDMPFAQNDMTAITEYFFGLLGDIFEYKAMIGFALNDIPKTEPFRPLLLLSHAPIKMVPNRDPVELVGDILKASSAVRPLTRIFFKKKR